MSLTCVSKGAASDTPVIFAPGSSLLFTSLASTASVSYTHLDLYKRQGYDKSDFGLAFFYVFS